ncbi:BTAD domain-containing putative transcriptional regulator [Terrabacter sp. Ter38]|uniref:AfsR/SARP family transcriptional regulator n=1 Tax=Terrabacter sp. Ter38 TaxID=2926030 RepID=UPI002117E327|nr:BTAD domain-containing putative transcriptional regulator [Terrabacter sp. Ter38]
MLIRLLGPTEVLGDDGRPLDVGGAKQRGVLAQLALRANVAVSLDRLAEGVWGEQVPPRYRQNVQVYVSTLRRVLEPNRPARAPSCIIGHREAYELVAAPDQVDVERFRRAVRAGRELLAQGRPESAATLLAQGLEEWRGTPLADLADEPFAADWVSELLEERMAALDDRIEADLARGRAATLVAELQGLVREHPDRERPWQHLMLALYRSGRQGEAMEAYRSAREHLLDESGIDPGPDLRRLADRILNQDPSLIASAPVSSESGTVPVPLTAVVGGTDRVARVLSYLNGGERLVVLTGPGGVGKTRLALAVAAELQDARRPLAWLPLEHLTDLREASAAIAAVLGVDDLHADAAMLSGRDDVLVLDNLEQLPGLGAPLQVLLEAVPTLRVLATSRSPLGVLGEVVIEVEPLDPRTDGVDLFAERARAHLPSFDAEPWRPVITRICERLDGLPLAIELVSARLGVFGPDDLLAELDPAVSSSRTDGGHGRQDSLQDLVGWSLDLLPTASRRFFEDLASLPETFDLDTAVAVGSGAGLDPSDARRVVAELVRAALLRAVETEAGRRFTMLNTVRAVGRAAGLTREGPTEERPDAVLDAVADAVADLWVERARRTDPAEQPDARRLAAARADLSTTRWVLEHLTGSGRADEAAEILLSGRRVYAVLGHADETLEGLVAALDAGLSDRVRARAMVGAGSAAYVTSDPRAEELLAAVVDVADDDVTWLVIGHTSLCALHADGSDAEGALRHAREGLARAEASGSRPLLRVAHSAAGWAALRSGRYDDARDHALAQLGLASGDAETVLALQDVTLAELFRQATEAAIEVATEALRLSLRLGPSFPLAQSQQQLGYALLQAGDAVGAAEMLLAGLRTAPSHHDQGFLLESVAAIGLAACMAGQGEPGRTLVQRSAAFAQKHFGVDCALSDPLLSTAERHGVRAALEPGALPAMGAVADLVEQAMDVAGGIGGASDASGGSTTRPGRDRARSG